MRKKNIADAVPQKFHIPLERRKFLKAIALASGGFALPGYLAEALTIAPSVTQGPYYPTVATMPLEKDNDLIYLNDSLTRAVGKITYLTGRVLTSSGTPIKGALVEIWHADNYGYYVYQKATTSYDTNFQGFGQFLTGANGAYKFRTVKAGLYNGRVRHYHLAVTIPGQLTRYCTQLFWNETAYVLNASGGDSTTVGGTQNSTDTIYSSLTTDQKTAVNLTYTTVDATTGAVAANFDFVVGLTPVDPTYPNGGSFVVAATSVAGPTNSTRFKLSLPAYTNYTYEVYGNPTLANVGNTITNWDSSYLTNMSWGGLPFSLTQAGAVNTNRFTASTNGTLNLYLQEKSAKGFYYVSFRVPGENVGVP
jgi:protocatechuate 3,4-dioxygenase beta subunit